MKHFVHGKVPIKLKKIYIIKRRVRFLYLNLTGSFIYIFFNVSVIDFILILNFLYLLLNFSVLSSKEGKF